MRESVLRFGRVSAHELGIGVFGVGLNRALFKLGRVAHLKTDTGKRRAELILNVDEYLKTDDWTLPAQEFATTKKAGTEIEIGQPPQEIAKELGDSDWVDGIRDEIGKRYGRFLARGFKIVVNGTPAVGYEVELRENGPFPIERKFYRTPSGVTVYIECGQHVDHLFNGEAGHSKLNNAELTSQFGWSVLCNERAILVADTNRKTGWDTKFHSEFYGFAGSVRFVSSDPSKLPWNTTKTDVDLNNSAYQMALDDMRRLAEKWRQFSDRRKRRKGAHEPSSIPPAPVKEQGQGKEQPKTSGSTSTAKSKPIVTKVGHNELRFLLPEDVSEHNCFDKHHELVREAKQLDLGIYPYSALALLRMLFESSIVMYMKRNGFADDLVQFAMTERGKDRPLTEAVKKNFLPKMDEMIAFLESRPDVWGATTGNYVKQSMRKLASHQGTMNTALHNPYQGCHRSVVFQIRDEVGPALRHLIEHPWPSS